MAIINLKTGSLTDIGAETEKPAEPQAQREEPLVPVNTGQFKQFQPEEARGGAGAFGAGARQGLINIGGGVLRTAGEIADFLGVEGAQKFLSDLEASQGIEQLRTQQQTAGSPIAKAAGEIVGETAGFPFGGGAGSLGQRAFTSIVSGATAGGLSEAGRGGSGLDVTGAAAIGGALGPVGEAIGDVISRLGGEAAAGVRKLISSKTGRDAPAGLFDVNGVPTPEAARVIDQLGITEQEFRSAFQETAEGVVSPVREGLPAEQALRQAEAAQEGVRLTRGQTSRDFAEQEAEDTLKGLATQEGSQARQFFDAQQRNLLEAKDRFISKLGDQLDTSRTQRGADVRTSIRDLNSAAKENIRNLYSNLSELPGGQQVIDTSDLQSFNDTLVREIVPSDRVVKGVSNIFEDFGELAEDATASKTFQGPLNFKNAEKMRKRLNKLNPSDPADIAYVSQLKDSFDHIVASSAEQFPEGSAIGAAAQKARSAAAERFDTFAAKDIIDDLIGFKQGTKTDRVPDSVIFDKLFSGGARPGGLKVENIKRVKRVLLKNGTAESKQAWKSIQTQGALDIFNKAVTETPDGFVISGAKLNTALNNFGEDALKELFPAEQLKEIRRLQRVTANATIPVPRTTNPSGTALKILNTLGRFGTLASGGLADKAVALTGAATGAIKEAAKRREVLDGIVRGAVPAKRGIAILRLATSPLAQRTLQEQTRDEPQQEIAP
jgi:hypothetical protein